MRPRFLRGAALLLLLFPGAGSEGQRPAPPPAIGRTVLLENDTVLVTRLRFPPGAREEPHSDSYSSVLLQLDAGLVDMVFGPGRASARRESGHTQFIPRDIQYAAGNAGDAPFDVVSVGLKPGRRPAAEAPPSPAPPGITRTTVLDNAETRVVAVEFSPSSRETTHAHPFDLVLVQLTPGRVEIQDGTGRTVKDYDTGAVLFLPRDVPHAVGSADRRPFKLMSVAIK